MVSPVGDTSISRPLRRRARVGDVPREVGELDRLAAPRRSPELSPASSTSSETRSVSSCTSSWTPSTTSSYSPGPSSSARASSSALVRRLVSGVRSSWLASPTRRCCSRRDVASASTIVVKLRDRLPISARRRSGPDVVRSCVRAMSSAVTRNRSIGFTIRPAISQPASTAAATPMAPMTPRRSLSDDEHVVDLVEAARQLERAAVAARDGEDAVALAVARSTVRRRDAVAVPLRDRAIGGVGREHRHCPRCTTSRVPSTSMNCALVAGANADGGGQSLGRWNPGVVVVATPPSSARRRRRRRRRGMSREVGRPGAAATRRRCPRGAATSTRTPRSRRTPDERGDDAERGRDAPTKAHGLRIR